jgi:hypothetical protein
MEAGPPPDYVVRAGVNGAGRHLVTVSECLVLFEPGCVTKWFVTPAGTGWKGYAMFPGLPPNRA